MHVSPAASRAVLGPDGADREAIVIQRAKIFVALSCFLVLVTTRSVHAADAENDDVDVTNSPVADELNELGVEYQRLADAQRRATPADGAQKTDEQLSDEEWLKQGRAESAKTTDPDEEMLPRFLAFAKNNQDSQFALDALAFTIRRGGSQTGNVQGKPWQLKEQAIDVVLAQHMDDSRVVYVLDSLSGSLPSQKTESFLRQAIEHSPDRYVQAAAGFSLRTTMTLLAMPTSGLPADQGQGAPVEL